MNDLNLYPEQRERFGQDIGELGFDPVPGQDGVWEGSVVVTWDDPSTGTSRTADHRVRVRLGAGFPYEKPTVTLPSDGENEIRWARHHMPGENGALCLYPEDGRGWKPWFTAADLVERVREGFVHHYQNDWGIADQPPDLHLYFPNKDIFLMLTGNDWFTPVEFRVGRFGIWQYNPVTLFAGTPRIGATDPPLKHADRLLVQRGAEERSKDGVGIWFRLSAEPTPQSNLDAMLKEIDARADMGPGWARNQIRGLIGDRIRGKGAGIVIALGYPSATGTEHWLFLRALIAPTKGKRHWYHFADEVPLSSMDNAPVGNESMMRRTGHTASLLGGKTALVIGQGAIGSAVSLLLAKAGVESIFLSDFDRLRPGNAIRHAAGLRQVGNFKHFAVKLEIEQHAPYCTVVPVSPTWNPSLLAKTIARVDVVVDATADESFSQLLNEVCQRVARPAVYASSYRRASVGRVRVVRPGVDACLVCYERGYAFDVDYHIVAPGPEGEFIEGGCGDPTIEASAVDIEMVANVAARSALRLLQGKQGADNECMIVNEPLDEGADILRSPGLHWLNFAPIFGCESCGAQGK